MPPLNNSQKTCLALAIGSVLSQPLQAATITVNSSRDNGAGIQCTLREAILSSNQHMPIGGCTAGTNSVSDNIVISELVTSIGLYRPLPVIYEDVSITGLGENRVTIDGNGYDSVLHIADSTVQLNNMIVTGGDADNAYGGGIHAQRSTLTISNSQVSENMSDYGGGINTEYGVVTISDSIISKNTALGRGGGLFSFRSTVIISDSTISENIAVNGGGGISAGDLSFNIATILNISNSTISANTASNGEGGGIEVDEGVTTITNSTISANSASLDGGGVYSENESLTVTNSTISGNSARYGGGMEVVEGTTTIINNTLTDNIAVSGGGLLTGATSMTLNNNIIAGNVASDQFSEIADIFGASTITSRNNLFGSSAVSNAQAFALAPSSSDIIATSNGLNIPLNQILSPLANNGGPTRTHALPSSSPAINAGRNAVCPSTDQRGVARNDDFCDIGAVEGGNSGSFYVIPLPNGRSIIIEL